MKEDYPLRVVRYSVPFVKTIFPAKNREVLYLVWKDQPESPAEIMAEIAPLPGFSGDTLEDGVQQMSVFLDFLKEEYPSPRKKDIIQAAALYRSDNFLQSSADWGIYSLSRHGQRVVSPENSSSPGKWGIPLQVLVTQNPEELRAEIQKEDSTLAWKLRNAKAIKVKIARNFSSGKRKEILRQDLEKMEILRQVNPHARLIADANRGLNLDALAMYADKMSPYGLDYFEDPLDFIEDTFSAWEDFPIALDESFLVDETFMDLVYEPVFRKLRAVVVKPMILGTRRMESILQMAARTKTRVVFSSSFETAPGIAQIIAYAQGSGFGDAPAGLDTLEYLDGQKNLYGYRASPEHGLLLELSV